jgi:hypothetical protein
MKSIIGNKQKKRYVNKTLDHIAKGDPSTTHVVFNDIALEEDQLANLAFSLANNTHVKTLYLHNTGITEKGAHLIAYALQKNITLEHLSLNDNKIRSSGAEVIAAALCVNQTLTTLGLTNNGIGNHGGKKILKMLRSNTSITEIFLEDNKMSDKLLHKVHLLRGGRNNDTAEPYHPSDDEYLHGNEDQDLSTYATSSYTRATSTGSAFSSFSSQTFQTNEQELSNTLVCLPSHNDDIQYFHSSQDFHEVYQGQHHCGAYIHEVCNGDQHAKYAHDEYQEEEDDDEDPNALFSSLGDIASYIKGVTNSIEEEKQFLRSFGDNLSVASPNELKPIAEVPEKQLKKSKSNFWKKLGKKAHI